MSIPYSRVTSGKSQVVSFTRYLGRVGLRKFLSNETYDFDELPYPIHRHPADKRNQADSMSESACSASSIAIA